MKYLQILFIYLLPYCLFSQTILPQQTHAVLGARSVLIVRGVDPATHTWTDTDQDLVNFENGLDEYIKRGSFNKTWVGTFDITPVYNFTVDPNNNGASAMSTSIGNMAINDGYNLNSYNVVVYIHQSTTDFGGAGALGIGNGLNGSIWGNNSLTWFTAGLIHETFHAFGLIHADGVEGGDNMFPGSNPGGIDPYHFMGSQGDGSLDSNIPNYMKYLLGWINPSEIELVTNVTGCNNVYRIYKSSSVASYNSSNKYAIQLGEDLWLSYEPDNQNSQLETKGLLLHYIDAPGASNTRLLDIRPNSISTLPSGISSGFIPVVDFWDAALESGDEVYWRGKTINIISEGGAGDEKWVDVEICDCVTDVGDSDNDGVCDTYDVCPGEDDMADADFDLIPDACDTCPNDPGNDSNNNNICDNIECLDFTEDHFDYPANTSLENNNGGSGFSDAWSMSPLNGSIEVVPGSLTYPDLNSTGNKVKMTLNNETQTKYISRTLNNTFSTGETLWVSVLVKPINIGNGGIWIKPDDNQSISIGKQWGTRFSIDNNNSNVNMVSGETYYLVARYQILLNETIVHLWLNRTENFTESNAIATKTVNTSVNINSVTIAIERSGDGIVEFDNLAFTCSAPETITAACISNVGDADNDGVCDTNDICPDGDDMDDADFDLIPDACDTCPNDPNNDANNNNICDNLECLLVEDHFDYAVNTTLENNNGGSGFSDAWSVNTLNGSIELISGSLTYPNLNSTGNKVKMTLINETETKSINRSLNSPFTTGETLWLSVLLKANNVGNGGFWIKPNDNQAIAIGKKWGTRFSIDNNSSDLNMIAGETNYLVARYQLLGNETIVHLWLNKTEDFTESNAIATKTVNTGVNINSVTIAMERTGDGIVEFDNLALDCIAPTLNNTLSAISFNNDIETTLKVFPNPAKNKLHLETNNVNNFTTKIIDIHGRLILKGDDNNPIIDVSNVENGMYFISFQDIDSKKIQTIKIIVKK